MEERGSRDTGESANQSKRFQKVVFPLVSLAQEVHLLALVFAWAQRGGLDSRPAVGWFRCWAESPLGRWWSEESPKVR